MVRIFMTSRVTLRTLSCLIAGAAILLGTSTSIAASHTVPPPRSAGPSELEMQVLLDRAAFSPGEMDGTGGKNSRQALAAFQTARGLAFQAQRARLTEAAA